MEAVFPNSIGNQILQIKKKFRGRKEMTSKKSKIHDLKIKTDFDYRVKEVQKKNQSTNKRIETFFPVSNKEIPEN
jgi:hypothetical protein